MASHIEKQSTQALQRATTLQETIKQLKKLIQARLDNAKIREAPIQISSRSKFTNTVQFNVPRVNDEHEPKFSIKKWTKNLMDALEVFFYDVAEFRRTLSSGTKNEELLLECEFDLEGLLAPVEDSTTELDRFLNRIDDFGQKLQAHATELESVAKLSARSNRTNTLNIDLGKQRKRMVRKKQFSMKENEEPKLEKQECKKIEDLTSDSKKPTKLRVRPKAGSSVPQEKQQAPIQARKKSECEKSEKSTCDNKKPKQAPVRPKVESSLPQETKKVQAPIKETTKTKAPIQIITKPTEIKNEKVPKVEAIKREQRTFMKNGTLKKPNQKFMNKKKNNEVILPKKGELLSEHDLLWYVQQCAENTKEAATARPPTNKRTEVKVVK